MAKRAPASEATYDPLDQGLAHSIINPMRCGREDGAPDVGRAGEGTDNVSSYAHSSVTQRTGSVASAPPVHATNSPALHVRGFSRTKRVLLTAEEERGIERLVDRVAEHVGASLKLSHLLRACMTLLCHAETEILRYASNHHLVRPANGDAVALAEFEQGIAKLLSHALRDAPPIR